jgi:hypothetical protein
LIKHGEMMKKILVLASLVVVAAGGALLWWFVTAEKPVSRAAKIQQVVPGGDAQEGAPPPQEGQATRSPPKAAAKETEAMPPFSVVIPDEQPPSMVNGTPVTVNDVIPPGVLLPGDSLPEMAHRKFMALAEEQKLLEQAAQEKGLDDTSAFSARVEDMRQDLEADPNLSDEDKQWRLEHFTRMVLIGELFRQEGLIPERISRETVDAYYESHSDDYEWLRKEEASKGSSPARIETKVKQAIKRDLEAPLREEMKEKRKAYIESLREKSGMETDVEISD